MGIMYSKLLYQSKAVMVDKGNFTSNLSLESTIVIKNIPNSLLPIKSALKNVSHDKYPPCNTEKMRASIDSCKTQTEIHVENILERDDKHNDKRNLLSSKIHPKNQIEKLGLHEVRLNDQSFCFSGVIYLPECYIVLAHYLTLYRLKLDNLDQYDFENWCLTVGHTETACKHSQLQKVYRQLKANYFNDAFIINRFLSKQNVHLRISDSFGDRKKPLRAFVVVGKRFSVVKSVMDCYCFNVRGKIPFIIRTIDEYRNMLKSFDRNRITKWKPYDCDLPKCKNVSNACYDKSASTPRDYPKIIAEPSSNVIEVLNIHPNSINDLRCVGNDTNKKSNPNSESYSNYMRYQGYNADINTMFYNSPIVCDGITYNVVSIIGNKNYAYILCKNTLFNISSCDLMNFHSFNINNSWSTDGNQSNSSNPIQALREIMQKEICESLMEKFYGVSLKDVPCGLFYVVQCTVDGHVCETNSLINEILTRHKVCGKVISKEYSFELKNSSDLNFILHLHGNERHVLNCTNELKIEGLARNFKLIHPQSGKSINESLRTDNQRTTGNMSFRD